MFIVFEWVDWCWKDTQLNKAFEYLGEKDKYLQIWKTKEPTAYTQAWKEIKERLKNKWFDSVEQQLSLFAQDRQEQSQIRKEISKHSVILSSRFDYSTYAYQWAWWLSFDYIYDYHDYENILIPDITFIFDIDIENLSKRFDSRNEQKEYFEEIDFLSKVKNKYLETVEKLKNERNIYIIDANHSIDEVHYEVKSILDSYF